MLTFCSRNMSYKKSSFPFLAWFYVWRYFLVISLILLTLVFACLLIEQMRKSNHERKPWGYCGLVCLFAGTRLPTGKYMFKVNNRNTRTRCEIWSKLTIKTPGQSHWRCSSVFIVHFEHISLLFLVFLLLTWSRKMPTGLCIHINWSKLAVKTEAYSGSS